MVEERLLCSESWRHKKQVDFPDVTIDTAGSEGAKTLHAVPADNKCKVMELSITHEGTQHTKVQLVDGETVRLTILCPPISSRVWSSQAGRTFVAGKDIKVQSSDITGGNTIVSGSGLEAPA